MPVTAIAIAWALADPVEFRWNAPQECPSEQEVRARVDRYVGDASTPDEVRAEAKVTEGDSGTWSLVLTTTVADGEGQTREIEDSDCEGLAETAAVLTALAVAPEAEVAPDPKPDPVLEPALVPEIAPEPAAGAQPGPEPTSAPTDYPPARSEPRAVPTLLRYGLRVAGGIGLGWLPLGADLGVAATIGGRWWSAELEGLVGLPRSIRLDRSPAAGANLLGWSVAGRGCGVLPLASWFALPICAGLEGGQVQASPVGLDNASDAGLPWIAALASTSLRAAVHPRVSLWLMPELQLGLRRPEFHATAEQDEVFASSIASGRVRAGLEYVF